ncbi:hypothetical protein CYMTET_35376, partial [Cymbomonas tetramitiformis]
LVLALPLKMDDKHPMPMMFGHTGRLHPHLAMTLPGPSAIGDEPMKLQFVSGATERMESALLRILDEQRERKKNAPEERHSLRKVVTAGGGAHKFKELFRTALNVELVPFKELQSVVDGLLFLSQQSFQGELFTVDQCNKQVSAQHLGKPRVPGSLAYDTQRRAAWQHLPLLCLVAQGDHHVVIV